MDSDIGFNGRPLPPALIEQMTAESSLKFVLSPGALKRATTRGVPDPDEVRRALEMIAGQGISIGKHRPR